MGVGGVLVRGTQALLIKRGKEPLKGSWVIPGGTVERGETLQEALVREMREETGLDVRPGRLLLAFDRILRNNRAVRYHYVILDFACELLGGHLVAGSDADEVAWVERSDMVRLGVPAKALEVVDLALAVEDARKRE